MSRMMSPFKAIFQKLFSDPTTPLKQSADPRIANYVSSGGPISQSPSAPPAPSPSDHLRSQNDSLLNVIKELSPFEYEQLLIRGIEKLELKNSVPLLQELLVYIICDRCVEKHAKTLLRKRVTLTTTDDYGITDTAKWDQERLYFAGKVVFPAIEEFAYSNPSLKLEISPICQEIHDALEKQSDAPLEIRIEAALDTEDEYGEDGPAVPTNGHEYEQYVAELIRRAGFEANVTPGSGDHGADIIAVSGGLRMAVQCKLYSSPVGNRCVQEAYSAQGFYDCHGAAVVSNTSFTPAAQAAAKKLKVFLLHHEDVEEFFANFFEEDGEELFDD